MLLCFTCRSLIHFELIFVQGSVDSSSFFAYEHLVSPPFVGKINTSLLHCLCAFVKSQLSINVWALLWGIFSVQLICIYASSSLL